MDSSQVRSLHWPRKSSSPCSLTHKATSSLSHRKFHIPEKVTVGRRAPLSLLPIPFQLFERGTDLSLFPCSHVLPPCPSEVSPQGTGQSSRVTSSFHGTGCFSSLAFWELLSLVPLGHLCLFPACPICDFLLPLLPPYSHFSTQQPAKQKSDLASVLLKTPQ